MVHGNALEVLSLIASQPYDWIDSAPQPIPIQPPTPLQPPETVVPKFSLSAKSRGRLEHLKPELKRCVERAIQLTDVDFTVLQTIRTVEEQKKAVASGNSRTMRSKHLRQPDGFAWAVDLGAWVNGKVSWEFDLYYRIAFAMDKAATELGIADHVRWGCAWDRVLSDFGGVLAAYEAEVRAYAARHAGSDLLDGPHFEWVS